MDKTLLAYSYGEYQTTLSRSKCHFSLNDSKAMNNYQKKLNKLIING